ncbi:hypothetical protein KAU09_03920 [Candidatus Parcubacteria bacterium]|nr:hypothetical protein [Candidatus Parcubacteria bacterium]
MTEATKTPTFDNLKERLNALVGKDYEMTQGNYYEFMAIKNSLKDLLEQEDAPLDEIRNYMMTAYVHLNKMEEHYENNGNKW